MAAGIQITLDLLGERQFNRRISTLKADLADDRPAKRDIAEHVRRVTHRHLASEGRTGARGAFVPLSARYREWKERTHPGLPILVLEGHLRAAATTKDAPGSIEQIDRDGVTVGIRGDVVPYAKAHQLGIPGRLHQRPVYDLTEGDKQGIVEIVRAHLLNSAQRAEFDIEPQARAGLKHLRDVMRGA